MTFRSVDIAILPYLSDEFSVSGKLLSNQLGISRVAVWKQIKKLKKLGYLIDTDSRRGYRIISRADILLPTEIYRNLDTKYIGKKIYYFQEVNSTNTIARQIALNQEAKAKEGTVIIAEKQRAGKGRLGKEWFSPPGGIWLSILLYPDIIFSHLPLITLMASVVITKAIRKLLQINVQIKWPNDLLIKGKKVCGILTETQTNINSANCIIVGLGINANIKMSEFPESIQKHLNSLLEITGEKVSRIELTQELFCEFEKYYEIFKKGKYSFILNEWKLYNNTIGKSITIDAGNRIIIGEAIDITEKGGLLVLVEENGQPIEIISGTIIG